MFGEGKKGAEGDRSRGLKDERVTKKELYQLHNFVSVLFMASGGFMMGGIWIKELGGIISNCS